MLCGAMRCAGVLGAGSCEDGVGGSRGRDRLLLLRDPHVLVLLCFSLSSGPGANFCFILRVALQMPQDQHATLVGGWRKGDRVSILVDHAAMSISKGDVGTVVGPTNSNGADKADRVLVDFGEGRGRLNCLTKTQLEHATLVGGWRKGDRVSILVDHAAMSISKGDVGTVVGPTNSNGADKADRVLVDFGEGKGRLNCLTKTQLEHATLVGG